MLQSHIRRRQEVKSLGLLFPELAVWRGDKNTIVRSSSFAILILNREMIIRGTSLFVSIDCFLGNLKEQYVVVKSYPLKFVELEPFLGRNCTNPIFLKMCKMCNFLLDIQKEFVSSKLFFSYCSELFFSCLTSFTLICPHLPV